MGVSCTELHVITVTLHHVLISVGRSLMRGPHTHTQTLHGDTETHQICFMEVMAGFVLCCVRASIDG